MALHVARLEPPTPQAVFAVSCDLRGNGRIYASAPQDAELPSPLQAFVASDRGSPLGLLLLSQGFLETWGASAELLGGNPIVPRDEEAAAIHTALLLEASAWIEQEGLPGLEVLLPMGPANFVRDERLDGFLAHLGLRRSYVTMARSLSKVPDPRRDRDDLEIAPAAAAGLVELYLNYAASTAQGEIELLARQTPDEHREYFDGLVEETLAHPASLAAFSGDRLIGFTLVADWDETASHLAWVGVLPEERGRGVGRRLLLETMAACREQGSERMSLYTDVGLSAESLYDALGFKPAGALTYRWRVGDPAKG
jgi:GNAT superfamily N-acetyltransferase